MVGEQHNIEPGSSNETGESRLSDPHRCLVGRRLGSFPRGGEINRGSVDERGEGEPPHKRVRTHSSRVSSENFFEGQEAQVSTYIHGQHDSITLPNTQRGDQIEKNNNYSQKVLGISQREWDHDYCVLDPIKRKQNSGLEVKTKSKLQRVGAIKPNILETNKFMGITGNRLLCIKDNEKTTSLHVPKSRPRVVSNKFSLPELGKIPLPVSTLLPNGQGFKDHQETINSKSASNSSALARTTLVSSVAINVDSRTCPVTSEKKHTSESHAKTTPVSLKPHPTTCGVSSIREQLQKQGFSESASSIMVQARRESTTCAYKTPWRKWVLWCGGKQVDPFEAPVNVVVEFLTELYHEGYEYRTINVYRSAISAYHHPVNGIRVGQTKEVCLLLSGIDNLRPPTPKYNVIWEVEDVLNCLRDLGKDQELTNKDLTLKTVMLMALTAIKRCSDLHIFDTRYMAVGENKIVFKLSQKPKGFRKKGKSPKPVCFIASGVRLCPVSTIKSYIDRTKAWREENGETRFFLSFVNPHKGVTSSTIGRWLKTVLGWNGRGRGRGFN
eukprot:TCONS_00037227-protein